MELSIILDYLIISTIASIAINNILLEYANQKKLLIDIPDKNRKFHSRATPVTGGIGILIALLLSGKLYLDLNNLNEYMPNFTFHLILISVPLLILFLIDDHKGLKAIYRLVIQLLASLYIIYSTDIYLVNLGDIFGFGSINLGNFAIPITLFCVVGIMNAFNMIDGINGLCAGFGMLSLLFIGFYSGLIYDSMLILIIGSMVGFLIFNLRLFGKKRAVFLGDSGSNIIGFWVAWSAIYASQIQNYNATSFTMIWFVAIPLLDCIGIIVSRIYRGVGIASPGRDHIQHKLMNKFSPEGSLGVILTISFIIGCVGIYLDRNFATYISTYAFIGFSIIYYLLVFYYSNQNMRNIDNV